MNEKFCIGNYVRAWESSPFAHRSDLPWLATRDAETLIRDALGTLEADYQRADEVAIHRSATVERGAILKGPIIIGPHCFVAAGAYLRGGVYLAENCIVGPNSELKTSFMFRGSKLAHLNFVGDSILGSEVNVEAGAIIANYRNEWTDKVIRIQSEDQVLDTGVDKFGALVGDGTRIGANAVIAPGALIAPGSKVARLQLIDQAPH